MSEKIKQPIKESDTGLPLPQPPGLPLLGNIRQLSGQEMYRSLLDLHAEYGDIFALDVPNRPHMVVVRSPEGIQHVLQMNNRNYEKGREIDAVRPLIGQGLFSSDGEFWRRQRRMMQPAFHKRQIALLAEEMIDTTAEMLARWDEQAAARADQAAVVQVQPEMMALTMEIVTRTLFSNSLAAEEIEQVSETLGFLLKVVTERSERLIEFVNKFRLAENRRFTEGIAAIDAVVYRLIEERRRSGRRQDDLLDMLLHAADAETGETMDDKQIRDEVITMFLAGHETTAIALSWALTLLSLNPQVRQKLAVELDQVLGGRPPSPADFGELRYTQAILQEALRLYPPLPITPRVAVDDDVIDGYHIPRGSMIMINFYGVHHHPDFWANPEGFEPERFMDGREKERHRFAYVPFGAGPRQCIGNNFAMMEGTLALAMINQRFRLDLLPGTDLSPNAIGTLRPASSLAMRLTPMAQRATTPS